MSRFYRALNLADGTALEDGKRVVTSKAWFDRKREPSVDCAEIAAGLIPADDEWTLAGGDFDGVCSVDAEEIRKMRFEDGTLVLVFDVRPDPVVGGEGQRENLAHHLILSTPAVPERPDRIWRRVRLMLGKAAYLLPKYDP